LNTGFLGKIFFSMIYTTNIQIQIFKRQTLTKKSANCTILGSKHEWHYSKLKLKTKTND
jgi:hypothetical protein